MTFKEFMKTPNPRLDAIAGQAERQREAEEEFRIDLRNPIEIKEATSYFIEYYYDRQQGYWTIQVFDNFEREVEVDHCGKSGLKSTINYFKEIYNTEDVRKV